MTMLDVNALTFDYQQQPLLDAVNFSLQPGEMLHLQGENGTGKTTLLKLMAGLLQPLAGTICFNGQAIHPNLAHYHQSLCFVGHKNGLNPMLTVRENCLFDSQWPEYQQPLDSLLSFFDLQQVIDKPCAYLSAGQKRRVALLRLAMTNRPLWLLDEPLTALDVSATQNLMLLFGRHVTAGGLIVLTSHQPLPPIEGVVVKEHCL